jgi:tetratricopeptide (TPR) repeat protein
VNAAQRHSIGALLRSVAAGVCAIVVVGLLSSGCSSDDAATRLEGKAAMRDEELQRLKRDIYKTDKSIEVTKELIQKAKGERYLPDLYFRLAELHIEKSRLVYFRILEEAGAEDKTAVVAPEARLLKDQAIAIYKRILTEFPDYPDNDKIRFFIAHEYRELGQFDEMIKTYNELIERHSKSPFRFEAWLILGDHYFDKGALDDAMKSYQSILDTPETYAHNMARYKLGWCLINKDKVPKAVDLWEKAVTTETPLEPGETRGPDDTPRLDVRREALKDLAFYYAEARNPSTAIEYFDQVTSTRDEYKLVLERLAKRFQIKTMYRESAHVYRELIRVSADIDRNIEWAQSVYDAVVAAQTLDTADDDVVMLAEVSARYKFWWRASDEDKIVVKDFELLARDLSTRLHTFAKERADERLYERAARAYKAYLSVFQDSPARLEMEWNYADALYSSKQYVRAGQQYERMLRIVGDGQPVAPAAKATPAATTGPPANAPAVDGKAAPPAAPAPEKAADKTTRIGGQGGGDTDQKQALYGAIVAYFEALKLEEKGTRFESMMAREGIKYLGAEFVRAYPDDANVPQVKFNVARAYYEQGIFDEAITLFTAFVAEHPLHKDAPAAAELAVDSYAQKEDFTGLAKAARAFAEEKRLADDVFRQRFVKLAEQAEQEEINRKTIASEGRVQEALATFIIDKKGTEIAAKALHQAFVIARDRRNFADMQSAGRPLLDEYGTTKYAREVLPSLADQALRASQLETAANFYEEYARRYPDGESAEILLEAAAEMRRELGEFDAAMADYERLTRQGAAERVPSYWAKLATIGAAASQWRRAEQAALNIMGHPEHGVLAATIAGEAAFRAGDVDLAVSRLTDALADGKADRGLADGVRWLGKANYLIGEIARAQFEGIQFGAGDDAEVLSAKFETLSVLEGAYVGAIQAGDPEWAMGGLYRIANAYRQTASFLDGAPVPAGLTPDDEAQYRAALKERADPLRTQAEDALNVCREKARDLQAFNRFVKACIGGVNVDEEGDTPRPRPRGVQIPGREALEAKLVENPRDLVTLKALIHAAIDVKDYNLARLLALRALDLEAKNADMQNLVGVATVGTNDMQTGAEAFKAALKLNPKHPAASQNLAALQRAYGDTKRAEATLLRSEGAAVENPLDLIPEARGGRP